ncbi:MAG: DNA polymerase III subunit chi [Neisseriaceae bacterium]|nr:hypothetical protein [Neisseriaceae bacterium PsAf]MCV2503954.1 DNA polymerase III subunit chi [Neisseriaceae bacterium]MCV2509416.1 DNA polymerase III subunit chi [Neisseriaceae bacterium]
MSPEIYFYIKVQNKIFTLCQLLQKIIETTDYRVIIYTEDDNELQDELSQALWSTLPDSFLANEIVPKNFKEIPNSPILISSSLDWINKESTHPYVLINLTLTIIEDDLYQRIIFIFGNQGNELNIARQLYKHYQKNNFPIKHFDMSLY